MVSHRLPAAFAFLPRQENLATDAALVEALPHLEGSAERAAFEILLQRGHVPSLAAVITGFPSASGSLQALMVDHIGELSASVRSVVGSGKAAQRIAGMDLIVHARSGRLAYLLADALRVRCHRTRESAAAALLGLTEGLLAHLQSSTAEHLAELLHEVEALADALQKAVWRWEIHYQPKALAAAMMLAERTEPTIRRKLAQRRSKIARALSELMETTTEPRFAGFLVRALTMPPLRAAATRCLARAADPALRVAVLAQSWLLADPEVERGARYLRDLPWLCEVDGAAGGGAVPPEAIVRWLSAACGTSEWRLERLRGALTSPSEETRRSAFWQLTREDNPAATDLLKSLAIREDDPLARVALRELHRRGQADAPAPAPQPSAPEAASTVRPTWERYWHAADGSARREARGGLRELVRQHRPELVTALRGKLSSNDAADRARALRAVLDLDLATDVEEHLLRLVHDVDPLVRAAALAPLARLSIPSVLRILRQAVNDPDPRVQANAVEALDRLNHADRVPATRPKLRSPHPRVRANAVKSLLRTELREAGETLLGMLDDPSSAQRASALWVVERLRLRAVLRHVADMSHRDADPGVRRRAARVLRELRGEEPHGATGRAPAEPTAASGPRKVAPGGPR
ncbi:MAG: HEAT repeat domain-containing protein [Planctomycetes bacterium]|nr:HEAT repeat domain-containing protein [Planctomycetota bacterium]